MSTSLARSRFAKVVLIGSTTLAATAAGSAAAGGGTITNPPRPTHVCVDASEGPGTYGTTCSDGSGWFCAAIPGSHLHACMAWDGSGGEALWTE